MLATSTSTPSVRAHIHTLYQEAGLRTVKELVQATGYPAPCVRAHLARLLMGLTN